MTDAQSEKESEESLSGAESRRFFEKNGPTDSRRSGWNWMAIKKPSWGKMDDLSVQIGR